jgi:hypothetical protein
VLDPRQPELLGTADCEVLRSGWWAQPSNSVTSLAFVAVGVWLAARLDRVEPGRRAAAGAFAALSAAIGVGSVAYHGPQFDGAQLLHDLPIVGLVVLGSAVPLGRIVRRRPPLPGWSSRTGVALAAVGAVGFVAYLGGRSTSGWCRAEALFQWHGLWHIAAAALVAMWGTFVWQASERLVE